MTLDDHRDYLEAAMAEANASPLSAKKALLVALLIDTHVDRLFRAQSSEDDILAWRAALANQHPALGLVFRLASGDLRLVTEAVEVPLEDYGTLGVEDFMVSLYNRHTVQRVRLVLPDSSRLAAHEVLAEAVDAIR